MAFEALLAASRQLEKVDLIAVSLEAMRASEDTLVSFNQEQMQDSIDSEGEPLGEYASIAYANRKGRITVDLKLTGDFYRGMFAKTDEYPVIFGSTDDKTEDLKNKYGENIFGTTKNNTSRIAKEVVLPEVHAKIIEALRV